MSSRDREINIGMVGYGTAAKGHINAYRNMPVFFDTESIPVLKAICGRTEKAVAGAAKKFGWQSYETSWEDLVRRKDIDLVDITTPNSTHRDIVLAAVAEGKDILCEKPLAMNLEEAEEMLRVIEDADVKHMMCFNFRKVPAIAFAKRLIDDGKLGRIYQFRGMFLCSYFADPNLPLVWRLRREVAGSGVHGDLNSHIIDLARYLVGEFDQVVGMQETFIKKRPKLKAIEKTMTEPTVESGEEMGEVTVDDATLFLAKFANGALGSFESNWMIPGRKDHLFIEINGNRGSLFFDLEDMNVLWFHAIDDPEGTQGFRKILVTESTHPYVDAWRHADGIIGYEHPFVHLVYDLMKAIDQGENPSPSFVDGVECQRVLESVEKSIREGHWIKVE